MPTKQELADQIGDDIIGVGEEKAIPDDDPTVGTPPLGGKEYDVLPVESKSDKDEDETEDKKKDEMEPVATLADGQFPATEKGIKGMEAALKTHQSAADKQKKILVEAGFVQGEDGEWTKPAESVGKPGGLMTGFDPDLLAIDILGEPDEPDVEIPKDYDPSNPIHVQKLVRGEVRAASENSQKISSISNQIKELVDLNPGISPEEIKETINWYRGGNLRLATLHAIRKGKVPVGTAVKTSEVDTSEDLTKADRDAAVAAALKDLEKAQEDRKNLVPGTVTPGSGKTGDSDKTIEEAIGDDIVDQSRRDHARRI